MRPTLYKPEYCADLMEHMQKGFSFESFAGTIGVSVRVLYDWSKAHDEFLQAKETGQAMSLLHWEEKVQDGLPAGIVNASVLSLAMRNLHKWRMKDPEIQIGKTDEKSGPGLTINFPKELLGSETDNEA